MEIELFPGDFRACAQGDVGVDVVGAEARCERGRDGAGDEVVVEVAAGGETGVYPRSESVQKQRTTLADSIPQHPSSCSQLSATHIYLRRAGPASAAGRLVNWLLLALLRSARRESGSRGSSQSQ